MIPFESSFGNTNDVVYKTKCFFWVAASVDDAFTVNLNGIQTFLANGFSENFIKGKPVFSNGSISLLQNSLDFLIILY